MKSIKFYDFFGKQMIDCSKPFDQMTMAPSNAEIIGFEGNEKSWIEKALIRIDDDPVIGTVYVFGKEYVRVEERYSRLTGDDWTPPRIRTE